MILSGLLRIDRLLVAACLILILFLVVNSTVDSRAHLYLGELHTTTTAAGKDSLPPMFIGRRDLFYRLNLPVDLRIRLANSRQADAVARS